jgi:hypothetical protein
MTQPSTTPGAKRYEHDHVQRTATTRFLPPSAADEPNTRRRAALLADETGGCRLARRRPQQP